MDAKDAMSDAELGARVRRGLDVINRERQSEKARKVAHLAKVLADLNGQKPPSVKRLALLTGCCTKSIYRYLKKIGTDARWSQST
jgi:hypothetical protein